MKKNLFNFVHKLISKVYSRSLDEWDSFTLFACVRVYLANGDICYYRVPHYGCDTQYILFVASSFIHSESVIGFDIMCEDDNDWDYDINDYKSLSEDK